MYAPYKNEAFSKPLVDADGAILLKAAQLIRERGHTKDILIDEARRLCAVGALNTVIDGSAYYSSNEKLDSARTLSRRILAANNITETSDPYQFCGSVSDLAAWNNAPERTADEVISALARAAYATA